MAAGDSDILIVNKGLIAIGSDPIASFTDPYKRAILANQIYQGLRRECLELHDWNFARSRAVLAQSAVPPPFGLTNAFILPGDFIRFTDTDEEDDDDIDWVIELVNGQRCVLTDHSEAGALNIKYVFDAQDPTQFSPLFVRALAGRIGMDLADPLGRSAKEYAKAKQMHEDALNDARASSSQQDSPKEFDVDILLRSRNP